MLPGGWSQKPDGERWPSCFSVYGFNLVILWLGNIVRGYYLDEGMVLFCMDSITPLPSADCDDKGDLLTLSAGF